MPLLLIPQKVMDPKSFGYNCKLAGMENSFLFDEHSEVVEALLGFLDDDPSILSIDPLFQNDGMDSLLTTPSSSANVGDIGENFLLLPSPKRHRSLSNAYIQEQPPPLFEPNVDPTMTGCNGLSLSTPSAAARKRRKRISQKTQELARLIPGGTKMNTADMLQAVFKYVKFLQAQLAILQLMTSSLECKSAKKEDEYLQVLLASLAIQERLAAEGMCIVPKEMVYELATDPQLNSIPLIARSMDQFIESTIKIEDNISFSAF